MNPESFEWATPVIFLRISDGYLYALGPVETGNEVQSSEPGGQMAARRWYQTPKVAVPVLVGLIGLTGTVLTVVTRKDGPGKPKTPIQSGPDLQPEQTISKPAAPPDPRPVASFPVIVIDDATGDHIAGAQVMADEQGVSTETDSQGRCTLNVRPGHENLRVTISRPGYQTKNVELTVFEGMDAARFRLQRK
jgi:hypothetical protein